MSWSTPELRVRLVHPLNRFKPSSKMFLMTVPRRRFFCGAFMLFLSCFVMLSCTSVCWCLVFTCWERADLLDPVCDVLLWHCYFPIGILGQVCCVIVSIPDLCPLSYLDRQTDTQINAIDTHKDIILIWGCLTYVDSVPHRPMWERSGRVLDSRPRGRGFEPHRRHCVVVLEQDTFILA